jgi:hypothetical protein
MRRTRSCCCAFPAIGQSRRATESTQKFPPPHACPQAGSRYRSALDKKRGGFTDAQLDVRFGVKS